MSAASQLTKFESGYNGVIPSDSAIESARSLIQKTIGESEIYEFEYNCSNGSLIFDIRLRNGFLLLGSLQNDGDIHANLYDDNNPNLIAPLDEIWLKYMPSVSLDELFNLFP